MASPNLAGMVSVGVLRESISSQRFPGGIAQAKGQAAKLVPGEDLNRVPGFEAWELQGSEASYRGG